MQVLVLRGGISKKQLSKQDMTTQTFISRNLTCIIKWGMTSSGWLTTATFFMHDMLHKKSGKKLKSHVMQCNVSVNDREGEPH